VIDKKKKRLDIDPEFTDDELGAIRSMLRGEWIPSDIYTEIRSVLKKIDKRLEEKKP